ncbi:transporter substrate-binding domain-containing protein [Erwinia sp. S63]|uniref:transporter substrate-binding domain-containing protein n=1 Tax=Erwinia sp. S63 TaxID=2769341 RepID=UPI00190D3983|nr:transporter substrate-binding domain-containing protein [Erwinia sp. S63]MBK0097531.1 transporter substrate-binding domain-containing protein [Erwinia sp. S63]
MFHIFKTVSKTISCAAILGSIVLSAAAKADDGDSWKQVKASGVLRCGVAASPPYVMRDPKTGDYSGIFPDLCRSFAKDVLKVKPEFVDTNWDNIVAGLQSEKWDISLSLNDTPERRKAISFSAPAVDYSVTFAYNKNNPKIAASATSVTDIDKPGVTVIVLSGTAADKAISTEFKKARIMRLPGFDETRLALMSKRGDVLADDNMSNLMLETAHKDWVKIMTPNPLLAKQGIAMGVRKDMPVNDIGELNKFIQSERASGTVDKLIKQSVEETLAQSH